MDATTANTDLAPATENEESITEAGRDFARSATTSIATAAVLLAGVAAVHHLKPRVASFIANRRKGETVEPVEAVIVETPEKTEN